ncbi:hypothetical protein [Glaciecola sp. SC05]|uniref:hypothetical protein n=1 Tax=Glaciecola sp. SC05 TaxID=1987355 RepID=UPI0035291AC1
MKLDPVVAQIISAADFDNFTTNDVRNSYVALKVESGKDLAQIRRKMYAELLKLVNKGWLTKVISKTKKMTRFTKTKKFDADVIETTFIGSSVPTVSNQDDKQAILFSKLNHYRTDLLLNMGEAEAYKELYSEHPELVDELQPQYNTARDNNTKILGKIRAIEGLINKHNVIEQT